MGILRLAVGLGNPGPHYEETRHNLGRWVLEELAGRHKTKFAKETDGALVACIRSFFDPDGEALWLATLPSYMNESGPCLASFLKHRDIDPQEMIVVVDDFSLPFGSIRLRRGGSSGGHNGLQSIIDALNTGLFPRLRIGIGPVPAGRDPADFVLESFTDEEEKLMPGVLERSEQALAAAVKDFSAAMNEYNRSVESK